MVQPRRRARQACATSISSTAASKSLRSCAKAALSISSLRLPAPSTTPKTSGPSTRSVAYSADVIHSNQKR